jgi:uncharacterized protein
MSQENLEVVQRLYRAMNARDLDGFARLIDADAEWVPDSRTGERPVQGRENVIRFYLERTEVFDELRSEPERFIEIDDQVLVFIRAMGRGGASGAEFDIRVAHLWSVQGGVVVHGEAFGDRQEALEAVGLRE